MIGIALQHFLVVLQLDGRLLPGFSPIVMKAELRQIVGNKVEIDLYPREPACCEPDMRLFNTLAYILPEADIDGISIPLLLPAVTGARLDDFAQYLHFQVLSNSLTRLSKGDHKCLRKIYSRSPILKHQSLPI